MHCLCPLLTMSAPPYAGNISQTNDVILSFSISLQMLMTTSLGFADAPGAVVERSSSQLTAQAPWIPSASVLESAAAFLLTLLRISIAVPRIKALLPSAILPISFEHRAEITGVLMQECSTQTPQSLPRLPSHSESVSVSISISSPSPRASPRPPRARRLLI